MLILHRKGSLVRNTVFLTFFSDAESQQQQCEVGMTDRQIDWSICCWRWQVAVRQKLNGTSIGLQWWMSCQGTCVQLLLRLSMGCTEMSIDPTAIVQFVWHGRHCATEVIHAVDDDNNNCHPSCSCVILSYWTIRAATRNLIIVMLLQYQASLGKNLAYSHWYA